jgi:glycine oxidase
MIDYLIVGAGIAGISFAETCLQNNNSILVFEDDSQNSSSIAAGIYNPVILKRFTGFNNSQNQIDIAKRYYQQIEHKLNVKLDFELPILRKFTSIEEQNNWFVAADKPNLNSFLSLDLITDKYQFIDSPFDYGKVLQTGYIDTKIYLQYYKTFLAKRNCFVNDRFNYNHIHFYDDFVEYNGSKFRNVVFAEGFGIHNNPFFNYLPLDGTKGELLIIKASKLNLDVIMNSSIYFVPLGDDLYKVGATYNWEDKSSAKTDAGKKELLEKIESVINCEFEVMEHMVGIRPTVKDRKPLLGTYYNHKRIHVLNGLGTRGVLLGPEMAQLLFDYIENHIIIPREINIERFNKYLIYK